MDNSFVLYSHGGSANHGCEALVRSTCAVLRNAFENPRIELITDSVKQDKKYIGDICRYRGLIRNRRNIDFLRAYLDFKLFGKTVSLDVYPYINAFKLL